MNIELSWDLFIIVIFALVIAYSFIIGKNRTVKVLIGTYIAILAADGIGNLASKYVFDVDFAQKVANFLEMPLGESATIIIKVVVFITAIVILAQRGGFNVDSKGDAHLMIDGILTLFFGFLTAALAVSTILVFVGGSSFAFGAGPVSTNIELYKSSTLVKIMVENHNLWFSLPAISLVIASCFDLRRGAIVEEA